MNISWALDRAKRIVDWDDDGRLADDEYLVEINETAIIEICRALLFTSAALKECAAPFLSKSDSILADEFMRRMNIAHEALTAIEMDKT